VTYQLYRHLAWDRNWLHKKIYTSAVITHFVVGKICRLCSLVPRSGSRNFVWICCPGHWTFWCVCVHVAGLVHVIWPLIRASKYQNAIIHDMSLSWTLKRIKVYCLGSSFDSNSTFVPNSSRLLQAGKPSISRADDKCSKSRKVSGYISYLSHKHLEISKHEMPYILNIIYLYI